MKRREAGGNRGASPISPLPRLLATGLVALSFAQVGAVPSKDSLPTHRLRMRLELVSVNSSLVHGNAGWVDPDDNAYESWSGGSFIGIGFERSRLRLGTVLEEQLMGWSTESYLPLKVGYTLWSRPVTVVSRLQGMVPEIAAELAVNWLNSSGDPWERVPISLRADIIGGADMLGLGLSVAAGLIYMQTADGHDTNRGWVHYSGLAPNLEVRLRAGTVVIDLTRR